MAIEGINEDSAHFVDDASRNARKILFNLLNESQDETHNAKLFLQQCHEQDQGFTYNLCYDNDGKLTALLWMSPYQRGNYEQFGSTVFLDMMKRQVNSVHWPYVSIVCLDADGKMVSCAEAFCCQERIEAYCWCLRSVAIMAPLRPLRMIKVMFGDGIFEAGTSASTAKHWPTPFPWLDCYT